MDIKQIEAFLAIVEQQSITKAAESLYISQSTVSYRLSSLEREVNTILIDRGKGVNHIALTLKGREFLPIAHRWFSLHKDTSHFKLANPIYPLSIAASESINTYLLADLYHEITTNEKNVNLIIQTSQSKDIYNLLESREIDVGFTYLPPDYDVFKAEAIREQEMVLVERAATPRNDRLVNPADLDPAQEVYVKAPSINAWRDQWFHQSVVPFVWVDTPMMILNFLNREGCWCVVPELMANAFAEKPGIHAYRFTQPPPKLICYLVTHRFPRPTTLHTLQILDQYRHLF